MTPNRLITLAIHTYEKALPIKNLLEREGMYVELNNVNLASPVVASGVRIRIREADLPLALRIVENFEIFAIPDSDADKAAEKGKLLLPTDFSDCSYNAVAPAMKLASRLKCDVEFLYAYMAATDMEGLQLSESYDYQLADIEATRLLKEEAEELMRRFSSRVKDAMKAGEMPVVKFTTTVVEGLPEEAILEYARQEKPQMIVMGTRAAHKKEADLIGSVTAEVLDSCRIPAVTIPETIAHSPRHEIKKIAFFCNLDQEDMLAIDALSRLFEGSPIEVTLIHIPQRGLRRSLTPVGQTAGKLLEYCRQHYGGFTFNLLPVESAMDWSLLSSPETRSEYDILCLPNRRRSMFARVFNPSMAHRILFRTDMPMIVIPV